MPLKGLDVYVGRKVCICTIHRLRRANCGSVYTSRDNPRILCAIHGSRVSKGVKYKFMDNP